MNSDLIDDLLQKTSRTFALAIPLLPHDERRWVGVGYLLFRIADTLEDAERLGRDERVAALRAWIELLRAPTIDRAKEFAESHSNSPPSTNDDYNRLVEETPFVIETFLGFTEAAREAIATHAIRSAEGMVETLQAADETGSLRLETMEQLSRYCYYVAGIVGEMLTELFKISIQPSPAADALDEDSAAFGEGLQLVNILKDSADDARDGRTYLPSDATRAEVISRARRDLQAAGRYADSLERAGADGGIVAFATLPRTLAEATLDQLDEGRLKVTRHVVTEKLAEAEAIRTRRADG